MSIELSDSICDVHLPFYMRAGGAERWVESSTSLLTLSRVMLSGKETEEEWSTQCASPH